MNNIEKIIDRINLDAQEQIDKINLQAEESCKAIRDEYDAKIKSSCEKILADAEKTAAVRAERIDSTAQLEARKYTLSVKQKVIEDAFVKATEKLLALPEDKYVNLLALLAIKSVETGRETLIFSAKDRERVGAAVVEKANGILREKGAEASLVLGDQTRNIPGGIIVSRGKIEINCALDVLVNSWKSELTMDVANILFE